ncbi:PTS sugar transporter subunit IIA [Brachybacterium sp. MASK1Z-5]|uniref:Ascorbate-specific PTS system EIIA component n=1 Tax=Brachybacterium halotolerans TaxID=2795215 RepID=A0ABS1B7F3_9MICO|nr:PTS sugar transporter subunit IIA [Brachybacterium halotolerans]MBK0330579.1 PTS sugar transporter subunit IIA [Brachybacterium halotolerans]
MPSSSPSAIADLLPASAIRLDVPVDDRTAAIRAAGDLLVDAGIAGDSYTDAMIRTVEEHGPYIVITPGFALAHARPDDSVARTGMSFARLAQPVVFGHESNDPVTIVMGLAAADDAAHQQALAALAGALADPGRRAALDTASSADEALAALDGNTTAPAAEDRDAAAPSETASTKAGAAEPTTSAEPVAPADPAALAAPAAHADAVPSKNLILTVCGNGLGTSLFLKNTAEQVLDRWGWSPYLTVEATDTISAKGRAKEADFLLTSGAIAQTLGDVGVPVEVIENFTSQAEIDAALRRLYAV